MSKLSARLSAHPAWGCGRSTTHAKTNHSCMMCCQTDPTQPSYGLIPALFLAIRKHDGSRPCIDPSSTSSTPNLSRSFLTLMINNTFWLGQSPIGEPSVDGDSSLESPLDPSLTRPRTTSPRELLHTSVTTPLCVSDRWLRALGRPHLYHYYSSTLVL
jgi:hypothetical protein